MGPGFGGVPVPALSVCGGAVAVEGEVGLWGTGVGVPPASSPGSSPTWWTSTWLMVRSFGNSFLFFPVVGPSSVESSGSSVVVGRLRRVHAFVSLLMRSRVVSRPFRGIVVGFGATCGPGFASILTVANFPVWVGERRTMGLSCLSHSILTGGGLMRTVPVDGDLGILVGVLGVDVLVGELMLLLALGLLAMSKGSYLLLWDSCVTVSWGTVWVSSQELIGLMVVKLSAA